MLSRYVPKMYAHASSAGNIAQKLDKLIGVWEGSKYFDENCYKQLMNPSGVLDNENILIMAERSQLGEQVETELRQTYMNYQKQHQDYERHNLTQIDHLQNQIKKIQG
jgi:hypothetical protein